MSRRLSFRDVHACARRLSFAALGAEALKVTAVELFNALPQTRQDEVWADLLARCSAETDRQLAEVDT